MMSVCLNIFFLKHCFYLHFRVVLLPGVVTSANLTESAALSNLVGTSNAPVLVATAASTLIAKLSPPTVLSASAQGLVRISLA